MIEANRFKLGLFVIIGFVLLIVALFMLGASRLFKDTVPVYTLFDESVQGLETGAPVKFKGVTIGRVSRVSIRSKDKRIRVDMDAYPTALDPQWGGSEAEKADAVFFQNFFTREMRRGLRCQQVLTGITGMKYIEIDYFKDVKPGDDDHVARGGAFYLRSHPSIFAESLTNVSETIARIASIDFKKISDELVTTLESVNDFLNDPKLGETVTRINQMTDNLESFTQRLDEKLSDDRIDQIVVCANETVDSIRKLADRAREELEKAEISQTTGEVRAAFAKTHDVAVSVRDFQADMSATLDQLERTLLRIEEFVRYLDEDPSSLIKGKQKSRVLEGESR